MGWAILVIICIIILIIFLNLSHRKKASKKERRDVTALIPDEHVEDSPSKAIDQTEKSIEDLPRGANRQPRIYKPLTTFRPPTEQHKSYVRYDWQKLYEDSIVSLFPEELSPASPFLWKANQLEREGADQILVEQALAEARRLDAKAYELYIARWSIIKKRTKRND
jgi:hypothetical protein